MIADFADRTHTGDKVRFYEDCAALGGILGNLVTVFHAGIPAGLPGLAVFGTFTGIFVGCWAMALAEILNVFPVFMRGRGSPGICPFLSSAWRRAKGWGRVCSFSEAGRASDII